MTNLQPIRKRIAEIDALRGFALFGILVVNIFVFHAPYPHYFEFYSQFTGTEAGVLGNMIFFFGGKFMFIFAFLFGYGAAMQYAKYQDKKAFRSFWWRRMFWLACFGILHILLFSMGDILLPYALLGLTLPWVLERKTVILLGLFLLIYLIPVYEFTLRQVWDYGSIFTSSDCPLEDYLQVHANGNWWDIFKFRLYDYKAFFQEKAIIYIPKEWSLFVIGIIAARQDLVHQLKVKQGLLFCLTAVCLITAWILFQESIIAFFDHRDSALRAFPLGILISSFEFMHGLIYIIGFWLLWRWSFFRSFFDWLRYVGKMSLTNYLLQSLVCTTLFNGYGLGWYGSCTPSQLIGIALAIFLVQLIFSYLWLQRYPFGPLEAWWRKRSYQKS